MLLFYHKLSITSDKGNLAPSAAETIKVMCRNMNAFNNIYKDIPSYFFFHITKQ